LIAELRQKVQAHIGRLSVSFHDSTKSGVLVSRIMSDVEGVRNLIGTGLVDLVGGLLTASIALIVPIPAATRNVFRVRAELLPSLLVPVLALYFPMWASNCLVSLGRMRVTKPFPSRAG